MHHTAIVIRNAQIGHLISWQLLEVKKNRLWNIFGSNSHKSVSVISRLLMVEPNGMPHFVNNDSFLQRKGIESISVSIDLKDAL